MNTTVSLLQNMFSEEAERLEAARKVANTDQISGLSKRSLFMARLQLTLEQEDAPCSSLIFIRISHLAKINRLLGRDKTDALLQIIGVLLNLKAQQQEDGIAARLNGTEFALLFKGPDASYVAQNLLLEISEELASIENNPACVYLSYAQFEYGITLAELLSQLDSAVASAELTGYSDVRKAAPFNLQHAPKSQEQWSQLIHTAIERQGVKLVYFPVLDFAGKLTQIESALRLEFEDHWFPAGRFLAIAERLGLSSRLDLMAIELALAKLQKDSDTVALAVNISLQSMQDQLFRIQLQALLSEHSAVTARLCFEVPENGVFQQLDGFRAFAELVQSFACQLGIEHFGKQFHKITLLQDLHLSYVKIDGSLIREIQNYPEQLQYLKGLHSLVQKFGIRVYAEALSSEQEYTILAELGLDGATGPYIVCDLEE